MRLFFTAMALALGSGAAAQNQLAENTPAAAYMVALQPSAQRPPVSQTSTQGVVRAGARPPEIPVDAPVVTLKDICQTPQAKGDCKTVITRGELDQYAATVAPGVPDGSQARLAIQYAGTLAFSTLAEKQGLERNPVLAKALDEQLKLVRMRFLASAFLQNIQQHTVPVAEGEIERYYSMHPDLYEQVQVIRVALPVTAPTESGRPLERSAVKAEMEQLRNRAEAGADLAQLLQDAFNHLHIQAPPPPLNRMTLRRGSVQGDEGKAFDLKPGELSSVLDLPAAFAVLKVESKDPVPVSAVRPEIEAVLMQERMRDAIHRLSKDISAEFNLQYLGLTSQPDVFALAAISSAPPRATARRTTRLTAGARSSSPAVR